jgi:hypothetical protein
MAFILIDIVSDFAAKIRNKSYIMKNSEKKLNYYKLFETNRKIPLEKIL